ncbi:hypothetical protein LP421_33840 (plasmid) [Rhizobium sp. RCAM05350]|nr:hypothetical protein LP421_33840 [Rhizobium sp. RCAM05350]
MGEPDVKRFGEDVTILTIGPSLYPALAAAAEMEEKYSLSAEVIDARSLVPFNYDKVVESVKKTGYLLVVSEASERGSFGMTLSSNMTRFAYEHLKAAPRVLGSPNWIVPGAEMESTYFPQAGDIIDVVTSDFYPAKKTNRSGVRNWDDRELAKVSL